MTQNKDNAAESRVTKSPTQQAITAFGGVHPLARALGVDVSTVQGWKDRDSIPSTHHEEILQAAAKEGIILDAVQVRNSGENHLTAGENMKEKKEAREKTQEAEEKIQPGVPEGESESENSEGWASQTVARGGKAPQAARNGGGGGGIRGFAAGVTAVALLLVGAVYTRKHWLPTVLPMVSSDQQVVSIDGLDRRVHDLEDLVYGTGQAEGVADIVLIQSDLDALRSDYRLLKQAVRGAYDSTSTASSNVTLTQQRKIRDTKGQASAPQSPLERREVSGADLSQESNLESVQGSKRVARLENKVATLQARVAVLQNLYKPQDGENLRRNQFLALNDLHLAMAIFQLRDALKGSSPFSRELELLQKVAADRPALLEQLRPLTFLAAQGLPSLISLQTELPALLRDVVAAQEIDASQGWMEKTLGRIRNFVSIRKIGLREGDGLDAILWRAEEAAGQGDLPSAVMELSKLQGVTKAPVEDWLRRAQQRLDAQETGSRLLAVAASMVDQGFLRGKGEGSSAANNLEALANSATNGREGIAQ